MTDVEFFRDWEAELAELRREEALRRPTTEEASRWLNDDDDDLGRALAGVAAAYLIDHAVAYPWQDVGVSMELATREIGVNDPLSRQLASAAVESTPSPTERPALGFGHRRSDRAALSYPGAPIFSEHPDVESSTDWRKWAGAPERKTGKFFAGYTGLDRAANDTLVSQVENAIARGSVDRDEMYEAIREGFLDPIAVIDETNEYAKPYETVYANISPRGAVDDVAVAGHEQLIQFVNGLDRSHVEKLAEDLEAGKFGRTVGSNSALARHLRGMAEQTYSGSNWRDEMKLLIESAVPEAEAKLQQTVLDAAVARGDIEDTVEVPQVPGLWDRTMRSFGLVTRPMVSVAEYGRQGTTNRLRQNINLFSSGMQTAVTRPFAGGQGGQGRPLITSPTLATPGRVVSPELEAGLGMAAGTAGMTADAAIAASPLFAPAAGVSFRGGLAAAGVTTFGVEGLEAGVSPERFRERFAATDIGVLLDRPDLAGTGLLLNRDLVALRRSREAELAPALTNGDLITFGRLGTLALPSWEEHTFHGFRAPGFDVNIDSESYNFLSGLMDFAYTVAGPGELLADTALIGIRSGRALPGVRRLPLLGNQDPFRSAGGITHTWRNTVLKADFEEWLKSRRGRKVAEALVDLTTVPQVMRAFGKGRIKVRTAQAIADLDNAQDITNLLRLQMGTEVQGVPRLGRVTGWNGTLRNVDTFGARVKAHAPGLERWSHDLPAHKEALDVSDLDLVYRWVDDYMANASMPRELIDETLDDLARTTGAMDRIAFLLGKVAGPVQQRVVSHQFNRIANNMFRRPALWGKTAEEKEAILEGWMRQADENVRSITRHYADSEGELVGYMTDRVGAPHPGNPLAKIGDDGFLQPGPHLSVEAAMHRFPVPSGNDIRDIRRISSATYDVISHFPIARELAPAGHKVKVAVEWATLAVWKPLVLLRAAYVMRVVGEEQLRIAAAGGDALINNPFGWLAWSLHRKNASGVTDINMVDMAEYQRALVGADGGLKDIARASGDLGRMSADVYTTVFRQEPGYVAALAGNISKLSKDPIARAVAAHGGVTDELVREILENPDYANSLRVLQRVAGDEGIDLSDPAGLRVYLESVEERIQITTSRNDDLRSAIATGKFGDDITVAGRDRIMVANDDFVEAIRPLVDAGVGPKGVKGLKTVSSPRTVTTEAGRTWRKVLGIMGAVFIEKPTNYWSRSPFFMQSYWSFVAKNADRLDTDAARGILKLLDDAQMPRSARRDLQWRLRRTINEGPKPGRGALSQEGMDLAARVHAMDNTMNMLYTMTSRNQLADAAAMFAPFAEAWAEILTTWGRNLATNPNVLRRLGQARTVLGDPDFAASLDVIPGVETIDGHGLIFVNDYGQEMIVIPWANLGADLVTWVGSLFGRERSGLTKPPQAVQLNSLNVGASILPGLGPVVSMPLSKWMPENWKGAKIPGGDAEVRDVIWPFGEPTSTIFNVPAVVDEMVPSWMKYAGRALTGDIGDYNTAQEAAGYTGRLIMSMRWLKANDREGKYDVLTVGPSAMDQLETDAKRLTNEIAYAQAFTAFWGPGPTQAQYWILDEDGNVQANLDDPNTGTFISVLTAANLFRAFREDAINLGMSLGDAEYAAYAKLVEATGSEGSIYSSIALSVPLTPGGAPATRSAWDWKDRNADIIKGADLTWGLFAAADSPADDEFYAPMYWWGIGEDYRERNSVQDWMHLANVVGGTFAYATMERYAEAETGVSVDDPAFPADMEMALSVYRQRLKESYFPNWDDPASRVRGGPTEMAEELERETAPGGVLAGHELSEVLRQIAQTRRKVFNLVLAEGLSKNFEMPLGVKGAVGWRAGYDQYLKDMQVEHPEVSNFIARVYRAEIREALMRDLER